MWSPQRWDLNLGHEQELDNFTLFSNYFCSDLSKDRAYFIASLIAHNYNQDIAVPSTWSNKAQCPAFPYVVICDENDDDFQQFLFYAKMRLSKELGGSQGGWCNAEQRLPNPRPVTVTLNELIELYWDNGGSYCCIFGVKGCWIPNSGNLLSIDNMDVKKGYEPGNLLIVLHWTNMGRNQFCWQDFLFWRDSFVQHHLKLDPPATYIGTSLEYKHHPTIFLRLCSHPGCTNA